MPFLKIPFLFEPEDDDIMGKKGESYTDVLSFSTQHIVCYYPDKEGDKTCISLTDGRTVIIEMGVEDFEDILAGIENIFELETISKN